MQHIARISRLLGVLGSTCRVQEQAIQCGPCAVVWQAVKDSEPLRKAVEEVQPLQVALSLRLAQSRPLYEGFRALREGPGWGALSEAQQRAVEGELRDFVLGGVALEVRARACLGMRLSVRFVCARRWARCTG